MEPKGVRVQCPDCTFNVVMRSEGEIPEGVTKVVEGTAYCPNCNVPMAPVASVDTTERPRSGVTTAMTLEQVAGKCVEIQREVAELASDLKEAAEVHKDAKKAYDAKLVSLSLAVERLGRVMGGEQFEADKPLLDIAEQPPGRCTAVTDQPDGAAVQCVGEAGHGGPHGNGDVSWESATLDGDAKAALLEQLRQRLAAMHIVVDVQEIEAWTLDQYDAVIRYVEMLESGKPIDDTERPAFLSIDVPEHITALHASLSRHGVIVALATLCAWTVEERTQAAAWAASEGPGERPVHVPAPVGESARILPRGRRKRAPAVEEPAPDEVLADA